MAGADAGSWRGSAAIGGTGEAGPLSLLGFVAPGGTGCERKEDDIYSCPSSARSRPSRRTVLVPPSPRPWGQCWYCPTPTTKGPFAPQESHVSRFFSTLNPLPRSGVPWETSAHHLDSLGLLKQGREEEEERTRRAHHCVLAPCTLWRGPSLP